ncbi:MAG TPA: asparagine synthase (glutamine-hydrolyzing) [Bacteroidia bacterium]|nr:asparagine synthase (glutamine-hydrolyzing) [Bacteroidia bacterium]
MCGINGIISSTGHAEKNAALIRKMNARLAHRGPDNEGVWTTDTVGLGHRRLSIIDLSPESNQPMRSNDGRYVIVYNGELYNYKELKLELQRSEKGSTSEPYLFQTASDTEVVLAAFIRYGAKCLDLFNGMFAFAIYDTASQSTFIARDRMGVKPLYYYYGDDTFLFSSEIRPIIHSGIKKFHLNREVLTEYCMYQTVNAPNTIVKGVRFLEAGHYLTLRQDKLEITRYYTLPVNVKTGGERPYSEICRRVYELLAHSVQRRMVSDVPFGAFLSGGIDSSIVVGLMSEVSSAKVNTFNVSFDEENYSEAHYARLIATKFGTHHEEIKLKPSDFLNQLPEALSAMDHPSGDGPNTFVVSKVTKNKGISMALSGIGGDELFAGYDVFRRMHQLQKRSWLNALPPFSRKATASLLRLRKKSVGRMKIAELLERRQVNFDSAYPLNRSLFTEKELGLLIQNTGPVKTVSELMKVVPKIKGHLLSAVSIAEMNTYLQHTLLRDADQMSMAHALEVREPFLDHPLVEYVLGIEDEHKFPHRPKKLLVDSVGALLPEEIVNRKKMGFVLPWQLWLKAELRTFCEQRLTWLGKKNLFRDQSLDILWQRFLHDDPLVNWARVWHLVVLSDWMQQNDIID